MEIDSQTDEITLVTIKNKVSHAVTKVLNMVTFFVTSIIFWLK